MRFDYFYPEQAEQFAFFRIPKALFRDRQFKNISTDAKVLYGLMLDRVSLSVKNQWVDQKGRVYIIFTLEEIMEELDCANQKATKLVVELEEKAGLIERKRQGLGKPTLIYVKNFSKERAEPEIQPDSQTHDFHDSQSHENHESRIMDPMNPDSRKSWSNKTESIKTDSNNTDPFPSSEEEQEGNGAEGRTEIENLLREQLMQSIQLVRRNINPSMEIEGILMTLVDGRTNLAKDVSNEIRKKYGSQIRIFETEIPIGIKAAEATVAGKSIFAYDKKSTVAQAYQNLTKEIEDDEARTKIQLRASRCR